MSDHGKSRHRARELVLRALYERQLGGSGDDAIGAGLGDEPVDAQYVEDLWRGVRAEYDGLLERVAPKVERRGGTLAWKPGDDAPARWWAVQTKSRTWSLRLLPASVTSLPLPSGAEIIAVRAVDRFGNASTPSVLRL